MIKNYKQFEWNSSDLFASMQAVNMIADAYGTETVQELDSEGYFGNLDTNRVLEEYWD